MSDETLRAEFEALLRSRRYRGNPFAAERAALRAEVARLRALVSDFLQAIADVPMRAVDCDQETVRKLEKQLRAELARQTPSPADEKTK